MTAIYLIRLSVLNKSGDGQAVLRQTDASGNEILSNLLVLQAVKAVVIEQGLERLLLPSFGIVAGWEQVIKQGLNHACIIRIGTACRGEALQLGAAHR